MLIPIGHEKTEVRRLPWVTIAVIAICFAAFLATEVPSSSDAWADESALEEAADYWMQHAYLEPKAEILDYVAFHIPDDQRDAFVESLREVNPTPFDSNLVSVEQLELDRLSDLALGLTIAGSSDNDYTRWGLTPTRLNGLNLLTHMFMHGGWLHLLGNLFLFFIAAPAIEDRWGRPLFGAFFLAAGAFAGAFYAVLTPASSIPLVGASGAIAGVLGAFLVRFWSTKIHFMYVFFLGLRWIRGTFAAPAWLMLPLWFGNELFQAWIFHSIGTSDGIAYWAHVGGFAFGASAALLISSLKIEERFIHPAIESKVTFMEGNPVLEEAMQARQEGELDRAFSLLRDEAKRSRDDTDLALAFWDTAVAVQQPEAAAPAMIAAIRRTATNNAELATQYWGEMTDVLPSALADPGTLLRILPVLVEREQQAKVVLALRQASNPNNRGLTAGLAFRVIERARELDPPSALQAAQQALRFDDIHESKRERIQQLVSELESEGVALPEPEAPLPTEPEAAPAVSDWGDAASIPLAGEDGPAAVVGSALDPHAISEVGLSEAPRALAADGELTASGAAEQLALAPQEEFGFDPSAQLDGIPEAEFGLEPDAELAAPDTDLSGAMDFGMVSAENITAEAEADASVAPDLGPLAPVAAAAAPIPATPPPLPQSHQATPPPLPQSRQATPPPIPTAVAAPPPLPSEPEPGFMDDDLDLGDSIADDDLRALIDLPRFSGIKVIEGQPVEFADNGLVLRVSGNRKARVEYDKVQAIAVAAVGGLAKNPVLLIDLLLNWSDMSATTLRLIRLRSDRFEPSELVDGTGNPMEAFRLLLDRLIDATNAALLPDEDAAHARPIHVQDDLDSYQREVLQAAG